MPVTAILDVDGTLVDTNYHHTIAWYRAFRQHGVVLPLWRVHRHIGMGGDQIVAALAGEATEREQGGDIRAAEKALYLAFIEEIEPFAGAKELLTLLKERGHPLVLASSAKPAEVEHYLDLLDARDLADAWTTAGDVQATKPAPDLVLAALEKVGGRAEDAVMVGDSTFDCESAGRAGLPTVAILTGGFAEQELRDAGALAVFASLEDLRRRIEETPLAEPDEGGRAFAGRLAGAP